MRRIGAQPVRNRAKSCYRDCMPVLPHNQRAIDALKPIDGKRTTYVSEVVVGLVLEAIPSGAKSWRVRYRTKGGRQGRTRAYTIGDASIIKLGPALDRAREILAAVQTEGRDPQSERRVVGDTFEALFVDWLERHAKAKKRSWKHDEEMYHRHVADRIGRLRTIEIRRTDVAAALDDIARVASGIQANRAQSLIGAVFNWAVNEGRLDSSPSYRMPKRGIEVPRERVITDDEIRLFWKGISGGPLGLRMERILRLALITGQRRSEIALAEKIEFQLSGPDPAWVIPGNRTKNGVMHRVPLTSLAMEQFAAAIADSETTHVFPGRGHYDRAVDPHAVTRAMSRLMADLNIENATVHDLRRTVGTGLARLGVSKDFRARVLNHVDGARSVTDAVYNQHEFAAEKRAALELWEAELKQIVA
jgi:integrase